MKPESIFPLGKPATPSRLPSHLQPSDLITATESLENDLLTSAETVPAALSTIHSTVYLHTYQPPSPEFIDQYTSHIAHLEAELQFAKEEQKRLGYWVQVRESVIHTIKDCAKNALLAVGVVKAKGLVTAIRVQANPPSLVVEDEGQIPACYYTPQPPVLNRAKLAQDLKNGITVPGAWLNEGGCHLRIDRPRPRTTGKQSSVIVVEG